MRALAIHGAVIAGLMLVGCSGDSNNDDRTAASTGPPTSTQEVSTTKAADTCPEITAGYVPHGLDQKDRRLQSSPVGPAGVTVTFEDGAQQKGVSFLSGVFGGITEGVGSSPDLTTLQIRGHQATVYLGAEQAVAVWEENPPEEPCSQYAVRAYGVSRDEFEKVVEAIH
ncbi:MAG: hypothetical protein ACRDZ7_03910 [Acidimicrobiia bacterium]